MHAKFFKTIVGPAQGKVTPEVIAIYTGEHLIRHTLVVVSRKEHIPSPIVVFNTNAHLYVCVIRLI